MINSIGKDGKKQNMTEFAFPESVLIHLNKQVIIFKIVCSRKIRNRAVNSIRQVSNLLYRIERISIRQVSNLLYRIARLCLCYV